MNTYIPSCEFYSFDDINDELSLQYARESALILGFEILTIATEANNSDIVKKTFIQKFHEIKETLGKKFDKLKNDIKEQIPKVIQKIVNRLGKMAPKPIKRVASHIAKVKHIPKEIAKILSETRKDVATYTSHKATKESFIDGNISDIALERRMEGLKDPDLAGWKSLVDNSNKFWADQEERGRKLQEFEKLLKDEVDRAAEEILSDMTKSSKYDDDTIRGAKNIVKQSISNNTNAAWTINDLKKEIKQKEEKLKKLEESKDKSDSEKWKLSKQIQDLKRDIDDAQNKLTKLEEELQNAKVERDELKSERDELSKKNQDLDDTNRNLKSDLNVMTDFKNSLSKRNQDLSTENRKLTDELEYAYAKIAEMEAREAMRAEEEAARLAAEAVKASMKSESSDENTKFFSNILGILAKAIKILISFITFPISVFTKRNSDKNDK